MDIAERLNEFSGLPRFPDGRINYRKSRKALVLNCFVKYKDEILLLKRSDQVAAYKRKWNSVGGYVDEVKPIEDKAAEELDEELGIKTPQIKRITVLEPIEINDKEISKIWITFPVLAELDVRPVIKLDSEHTEYKWIKPGEIKYYDTIKGLKRLLDKLFTSN